jgi:hypothetical protein
METKVTNIDRFHCIVADVFVVPVDVLRSPLAEDCDTHVFIPLFRPSEFVLLQRFVDPIKPVMLSHLAYRSVLFTSCSCTNIAVYVLQLYQHCCVCLAVIPTVSLTSLQFDKLQLHLTLWQRK